AAFPLVVSCLLACCLPASAADPAALPVAHLTDGSFLPGEVRPSDDPGVLRWRSPAFARPLDFPLGRVNAVHYPVAGPPPKPAGEYGIELINDDVLFGDLRGLTDDALDVDSARLGRVRLRREHVRRLFRTGGADLVYVGPNGLAGWKESAATPQWRDEGGQLVTDQRWASLYADVGLPEKALVEVELSWKQTPDFLFALGVEDRDMTARSAFRFERWDDALVVVGETARDADVAAVQSVGSGPGRVRVRVYLDQGQRRLILLARDGAPLATLSLKGGKPAVHAGVRLTNGKGDVRLEQLRITRWNGLPPRDVRADQARVHRTDGSITYGRLAAYDPAAKRFTVRDCTTETVVPQDAIADVFLPQSPADDPADPTLRVVYR